MKTIQHPSFVRLLNNIVNEIPTKVSGTYNTTDPTAFEKGEMKFEYKGKRFLITFWDCTWGIEITIYKREIKNIEVDLSDINVNSIPDWAFSEKEIAGFYINRNSRFNEEKERWEGFEEVILRQKGLKGMIGLLGSVFSQCLKPDFISLKEQLYERERENDWGLMKEYV